MNLWDEIRIGFSNGGADRSTLASSIWNYNHSWEYVVRVLNVAAQLETAKGGG